MNQRIYEFLYRLYIDDGATLRPDVTASLLVLLADIQRTWWVTGGVRKMNAKYTVGQIVYFDMNRGVITQVDTISDRSMPWYRVHFEEAPWFDESELDPASPTGGKVAQS